MLAYTNISEFPETVTHRDQPEPVSEILPNRTRALPQVDSAAARIAPPYRSRGLAALIRVPQSDALRQGIASLLRPCRGHTLLKQSCSI